MNQVKKVWDIITLGKLKWYLLGVYLLGWMVPMVVSVLQHSWAGYDLELYFIYKNLPYYSLTSHLNYIWVTSRVYQVTNIIIAGMSSVLILIAYLRE